MSLTIIIKLFITIDIIMSNK